MNQFIFIIIILVILVLFKILHLYEGFESQQNNIDIGNPSGDSNISKEGIYNYFYQQVMNPYKYPMTPFFSNNSQELPKPSPKYPEY